MTKNSWGKVFLFSSVFFVLVSFSSMGEADTEPLSGIQDKLSSISDEEKKVIEKMFVLTQEIDDMDKIQSEIAHNIEVTKQEVEKLKPMIEKEEMAYEKNCDALKQVLKTYQKSGPASYIEIILDSDSLTTFIRRVNTLRDLTGNTAKLLDSLELRKAKLIDERLNVDQKLASMKDQQKKLQETLQKKIKLKEDLEKSLAAFKEKETYYQEYLMEFKRVWRESKSILPETMKTFSKVVKEGNLPKNAIKTRYASGGIKGILKEETFNKIIGEHPLPSKLSFQFSSDKVQIAMLEKNIVLSGNFVIENGQTLRFQVEQGTFYGMPIDKHTLEELLSEGPLTLNLKPLLGKNVLKSIKIREKYIELQIAPVLF